MNNEGALECAGNSDLREKIDEAKRQLPLPSLMQCLGLGTHVKKSARCPFPGHDDKHPSFSVFQGQDGFWHYNCFSKCGDGDEIIFLKKLKGLSLTGAMNLYLDMAGFPPGRSHKSRECTKSHEYPKALASPGSLMSPESPVYPMSNGQGLEQELEGLAACNACTEHGTARKRRWQLVRDLRAVEKRIARFLSTGELMRVFNE